MQNTDRTKSDDRAQISLLIVRLEIDDRADPVTLTEANLANHEPRALLPKSDEIYLKEANSSVDNLSTNSDNLIDYKCKFYKNRF